MKPGDLLESSKDEKFIIWSSLTKEYTVLGIGAIIVSVDNIGNITWLYNQLMFKTSRDDVYILDIQNGKFTLVQQENINE